MSVGYYLRKAALNFSWHKATGASNVAESDLMYLGQIHEVVYQ